MARNRLPAVTSVRKVTLDPGDRLIITTPQPVNIAEADRILARVRADLGLDATIPATVLGDGLDIAVLTPAPASAPASLSGGSMADVAGHEFTADEITAGIAAAIKARDFEAAGAIQEGRDPLPLRSLAELCADVAGDVAADMASEARGYQLLLTVLVGRLGGDVTIGHADLGAARAKTLTRDDADETSIRLTVP